MEKIRPLVKYHGGKGRLFQWIIPHIPDHTVYCESYGGAAAVLMNKPCTNVEVYNDLDPRIVNLMRVAKEDCGDLIESLQPPKVKYEKEFYLEQRSLYYSDHFDTLDRFNQAVNTYIVKRMSRGGLGGTFCWADREYSGGPSEIHCWNTSLSNVKAVSRRLAGVEIRLGSAIDVIREFDSPSTVHYLDPTYLKETRSSPTLYKKYEMTKQDHIFLATVCHDLRGKVLLSGYPSDLYCSIYDGWRCSIKEVGNHSSHKKKKEMKKECLWMNF